MHLKSLTLKGFKSFPDRTKLEFSPGVSVVVGPNGSGKSNITDAVLWALGEQSPLNVRGQSMQDVIFAGAHGVQARSEAEVEVVLDNSVDGIDLPMSEIAISRRLDRAGEGEYRINGAKCRLTDVIEVMSDTGLGKEMHSVVSQGRVTSIVTSKPRDRRVLIEEAAGLGKHRKRRRRAQLKLERTQDNLDRALDVEREARSRLRPLKRQAEAAELHERLERQTFEARWTLARDGSRAARASLVQAEAASAAARTAAGEVEGQLREVAARRAAAEAALTSRGADRDELSNRFHRAQSALERLETREEYARGAVETLTDRAMRRRALVEALESESAGEEPDETAEERIRELGSELEQLSADAGERLARELEAFEAQRSEAAAEVERLASLSAAAAAARREADEAFEAARSARREAEGAADRARREAARVGSELASVNQFLRSHAGAPGGAPALADSLRAHAGAELALAAVLGPRLRAAVANDLLEARALLEKAGRDGGTALVPAAQESVVGAPLSRVADEPVPFGEQLLDHVTATGDEAKALAAVLLADVYLVEELKDLENFTGIAVTREGLVWDGRTGELRRVPAGGEDRVLAERNRRDGLIKDAEAAAAAEQDAKQGIAAKVEAARAADSARDEAERAARGAARAHADAQEAERRIARASEQRRKAPDDAETAARRAQLQSALNAEQRLLEKAAREREQRTARIAAERDRAGNDEALVPHASALATALHTAAEAVRERVADFEAALNAEKVASEQLAGELRACAQQEAEVQAALKAKGEEVTRAEVRAQQVRDFANDAERELTTLAERLGLEALPADEELPADEREQLNARIERLNRRREQLGPVNPLAKAEYDEAVAHVEELETQRGDLENAIRELQGVIKETDQKIKQAFEETFAASAKHFEEVVAQLFPGGRGRLRLVREDSGPRPVIGGQDTSEERPETDDVEAAAEAEAEAEEESIDESERLGVEIELTPAGKATKRLSLLSGGEKSMTALAFLFAVFLARPCPFYILDEVEAALDDLNIDRFLTLLRQYSDKAQFIVVTHQKRTMEAADCLYGVSMAGNGVSKVVSRKLPRAVASAA